MGKILPQLKNLSTKDVPASLDFILTTLCRLRCYLLLILQPRRHRLWCLVTLYLLRAFQSPALRPARLRKLRIHENPVLITLLRSWRRPRLKSLLHKTSAFQILGLAFSLGITSNLLIESIYDRFVASGESFVIIASCRTSEIAFHCLSRIRPYLTSSYSTSIMAGGHFRVITRSLLKRSFILEELRITAYCFCYIN